MGFLVSPIFSTSALFNLAELTNADENEAKNEAFSRRTLQL
jgi:hypothetical protein